MIPQEGQWYKERNIYIRIGQVDAGGKWTTIYCYVMRPAAHYFDRAYMQTWTKQQQSVDGMQGWELLPEPPDNVLEALNWQYDRRGYYGPKPRESDLRPDLGATLPEP
jgi:hypothetical protein